VWLRDGAGLIKTERGVGGDGLLKEDGWYPLARVKEGKEGRGGVEGRWGEGDRRGESEGGEGRIAKWKLDQRGREPGGSRGVVNMGEITSEGVGKREGRDGGPDAKEGKEACAQGEK